ncbi:DUF6932 family protein [Bacillus cereus]|uniref:DUF6932 family protein n=1 Tax=Bacillus cereus TaxID=1396 RepID=UPI001CFDFE86
MDKLYFEGRNLKPGIYKISGQSFLGNFVNTEYRKNFEKSITDIFDFAYETNAEYLFFGGSFVSLIDEPNDIDCLIVYKNSNLIPQRSEVLLIDDVTVDIMFASLDYKTAVDAYVHLFTHNQYNKEKGAIQIVLNNTNECWEVVHPNNVDYELIKLAYINRHVRVLKEPKGIIVTIHGLLSSGVWNREIAPIVSNDGWIFAPYFYEENTPMSLLDKKQKDKAIDNFRSWIFDLSKKYEKDISVIAHSFGTYILTSYLEKFADPPVKFDVIILTGSIINEKFDWEKHRGKNVGKVLNEIAPNDNWVSKMGIGNLVFNDPLFGTSGKIGFSNQSSILEQSSNEIFDHNNVIKKDVIEYKWLPFLNANRNALRKEFILLRQ